ncbi:MAG: hypothetical protein VSS52_010580 [Thiotrichaceae bacterium]|nr:hypothetical protein [Thiotrichaceae bacterium]
MQIDVDQLTIASGSVISLSNIDRDKFGEILEELGETRALRLAYDQFVLGLLNKLSVSKT